MKAWMIWGGLGLLFGLAMQVCGFSRRRDVQAAAGLTHRTPARTWLFVLGTGMLLTALLCYLAVIDVDRLRILPLHSGVLLGGVLAGAAIGLCGLTPAGALCGIGGGRLTESVSCLLGAAVGWLLLPYLPLEPLRRLITVRQGTLFRLTLRDPWLLEGRFRGLACLGLLLCAAALFVHPRETQPDHGARPADAAVAEPSPDHAAPPADDAAEPALPIIDEWKALDALEEPVEEIDEAQADSVIDEWQMLDALEEPVEEIDRD